MTDAISSLPEPSMDDLPALDRACLHSINGVALALPGIQPNRRGFR
jgi:hypothetical protein